MFHIKTNAPLTLRIEGCPKDGLAAADFRRTHHIPEAPHDCVTLAFVLASESVCRRFAGLLNEHADILLGNYMLASHGLDIRHLNVRDGCGCDTGIRIAENLTSFTPATIAALLKEPTSEHAVTALLSEIEAKFAAIALKQKEADDEAARVLAAQIAAAHAYLATDASA